MQAVQFPGPCSRRGGAASETVQVVGTGRLPRVRRTVLGKGRFSRWGTVALNFPSLLLVWLSTSQPDGPRYSIFPCLRPFQHLISNNSIKNVRLAIMLIPPAEAACPS